MKFRDVEGLELAVNDEVAFATTTKPGRGTHAVLKVGLVEAIKKGKAGPYVVVVFYERCGEKPRRRIARESAKLARIKYL